MRKKIIIMMLAAMMMLSMVGITTAKISKTSKYAVTQPITITWWHAHEDQWHEYLNYMVKEFHKQNPLITVEPVYIGSYAEINTKLVAAVASGDVPALCTANTSYPASYGAAGICEILDPYIKAYNFYINDFGKGLIASTSYKGNQICLPYLISTQVMYYNKTKADAEGITMPKTFKDMDAFLKKATIFKKDGATARYGTVFAGWDYWYYEMLYKNNGVELIRKDGLTTDVNSKKSVYITTKIKEWIDKGYAYYAYGTGASANMRQLFWDGGAFSVFHTSSLYDTYVQQTKGSFKVGISWLPGGANGKSFKSEVGGSVILIPAVASQRQKNAAWQFMRFMASPEMNLYWADKTGYFPTRQKVIGMSAYKKYLTNKPAMGNIVSMGKWINPRNQHPAYDTVATQWRHTLSKIFNEGAPVKATLDSLAKTINETLEDF
jgi:multiple sugar transport system substrate-binding protein